MCNNMWIYIAFILIFLASHVQAMAFPEIGCFFGQQINHLFMTWGVNDSGTVSIGDL